MGTLQLAGVPPGPPSGRPSPGSLLRPSLDVAEVTDSAPPDERCWLRESWDRAGHRRSTNEEVLMMTRPRSATFGTALAALAIFALLGIRLAPGVVADERFRANTGLQVVTPANG